MQEIYGIIALSLGAPPKGDDTFTWQYVDKDGEFHTLTTTPLDFYKDNMRVVTFPGTPKLSVDVFNSGKNGISSRFSLVNDPRNPYMRLLTVDRLGNVFN